MGEPGNRVNPTVPCRLRGAERGVASAALLAVVCLAGAACAATAQVSDGRVDTSGRGSLPQTAESARVTEDEGAGSGVFVAEEATGFVDPRVPTTDESAPTTTETTMAPSTSTARRHMTPVTLSSRAPPSGPGVPPIPSFTASPEEQEFFACVVFRESSGNPAAINYSSGAAGLYQFIQSTWDAVARRIGRYDLVGVNAALAPVEMQNYFAHVLFQWQGAGPWASDGCKLRAAAPTTSGTGPTSTTIDPWSIPTSSVP